MNRLMKQIKKIGVVEDISYDLSRFFLKNTRYKNILFGLQGEQKCLFSICWAFHELASKNTPLLERLIYYYENKVNHLESNSGSNEEYGNKKQL